MCDRGDMEGVGGEERGVCVVGGGGGGGDDAVSLLGFCDRGGHLSL